MNTPLEVMRAIVDNGGPVMSKFEGHSPGPWKRKGWAIVDSSGVVVCRMQPWDESGCRIDDNADAELIAAAPDLLATRDQLREAFAKFIDQACENVLEPDKLYIYEERARAALKEADDES